MEEDCALTIYIVCRRVRVTELVDMFTSLVRYKRFPLHGVPASLNLRGVDSIKLWLPLEGIG